MDLTEVALDALENYENSDSDGASEEGQSAGEENAGQEPEPNTREENTSGGAGDEAPEAEEAPEGEENSADSNADGKKDVSDAEFERMAKERGYFKPNETERKLQETQEQLKREQARNNLPKPRELDQDVWDGMGTEQKIIYNRLDYITVRGKNGDVRIKTPEQLPDDFEFASDKARAKFMNDIQAQETKAENLHNAIQSRIAANRQQAEQQARAQRMVSEISDLQKSGLLPTPKAKPTDKGFNQDPATQQIDKVLNYMTKRQQEGLNLSVKDALTLYKAEHPDEFEQEVPKAKGDSERKEVSRRVSGNNKSSNKPAGDKYQVRYWKPGMSTDEVLDRALRDLD